MQIREGGLDDPQVLDLLRLHLASAFENSPPGSVHALDLSGLRDPALTFWTIWDGETLLGMGALKDLGGGQGEVKSMRTVVAAQGRGVGAAMLRHIVGEARARGTVALSLETGSNDAFAPARAMYARAGFTVCGAFADYPADDAFSHYMRLVL